MSNLEEEITALYEAIISKFSYKYEELRAHLIFKHGYEKFREMQKLAFERIKE